ncbi:MAG: formate--tetrahydrofolate ligase [Streptococcaceae bacterium]|jgi:formate--tetrahydrofolate ligase|nr:formate--tetrahydrofolate ligase [Streptococcaceae bacterium]
MKTDIEIARAAALRPITEIAGKLGLSAEQVIPYGTDKAKIQSVSADRADFGKLVLVTAVNPTPAGEGKTTVSIGLSDALSLRAKKVSVALREPSLGPVFGMKGGATGGGYAQVAPMDAINLHFTGDFHAIESANNLIAAVLDNSLYQGNVLEIDPERVVWRRAMDMNDRALREITVGEGAEVNGITRKDGFEITAASEIMAALCLATDLADLKARLSRMVVAYTNAKKPVTIADLGVVDAAALLLKDALLPNLVQTLGGTPAFVHGGPFANIAHGCNSVVATRAALAMSDVVVTEAGFGADLGAEKFLDLKVPVLGKVPDVLVLVATVRALKYNGGVARGDLADENVLALTDGFQNLARHIANLQNFGLPVVVALNRFATDTEAEIARLTALVEALKVPIAVVDVFEKGGEGGLLLADEVLAQLSTPKNFTPAYAPDLPVVEKLEKLVVEMYGGDGVALTDAAKADLARLRANGWDKLPICVAKTPASFSDNAKLLGAPRNFTVTVRGFSAKAGAGFVVVYLGKIITMPGLPKKPAALGMTLSDAGEISGLS